MKLFDLHLATAPNLMHLFTRLHNMSIMSFFSTCRGLSRSILITSTCHSLPATLNAFFSINANEKLSKIEPKDRKKPIWFYNNIGIRKRKIDQLFRHSNDECVSSTEDVIHLQRLLKIFALYNFTEQDVCALLYKKPRLFQLSKAKLLNQMKSLSQLNLPDDTIKEMIVKCPSLLQLESDVPIQKRLNQLQELPMFPHLDQQRCLYLIQKCPKILLTADKNNLHAKVKSLMELGFNQQQIFQLLMKHPAVLTYSKESVAEKVNYLVDEMDGRLALFTKFPRILSCSLQRIRERHLFLLSEGFLKRKTYFSENKLRAMVLVTDSDFVYRVTKTRMKDFRQFQERVRKNEITNENIRTYDDAQFEDTEQDFDEDVEFADESNDAFELNLVKNIDKTS